MSSYHRRHNGRPRPPPARNRPGHHPSSQQYQTNVDPHYLAYLRSQAAQIDSQISALSGHRVTPSTTVHQAYSTDHLSSQYHPMSHSHRHRRNPEREGSKWRYYAVKNGLEGDDVYSSWHQAYPYCWNPATQIFYPGSLCKGFNDYDQAYNTPQAMNNQAPVAANRVITSVNLLPDVPERYDGYESVMVPPPDSDSDTSTSPTVTELEESLRVSKINENSNSYSTSFHKFLYMVGSINRCHLQVSQQNCYRISSTVNNEYPIIIDSGATHHMWNDASAFLTLNTLNHCYVNLANNYKVPIKGQGTIQLQIQGYILHIHNVYLVPKLQFSLYSVKQHCRYIQCSCVFDNTTTSLNFPKFSFNIDDEYDMLIYGKSVPKTLTKIHWSSMDGTQQSVRQVSTQSPIPMPDHKTNPNKQTHRKISNIDIHKYLGFRTLKSLKPFQQVSKNNISFINAGEIPLTHGLLKSCIPRRLIKSMNITPLNNTLI